LKPSAGHAQYAPARASLAQTRSEKIGEDDRLQPVPSVLQRRHLYCLPINSVATGIVQPWTMTRLERCTPLTSATRAAWTRGPLLHPKSSLKENPAQ